MYGRNGIRQGLWFYGLAGSGKTFASEICRNFMDNIFIIDGDTVRQLLGSDLGYSINDRRIQLNRMLGLTKLALKNKMFPVISTVTMTESIIRSCNSLNIDVVEIIRPFDQLIKVRKIYNDNEQNVVGKDIKKSEFPTQKLLNDGTDNFIQIVRKYAE